MCSVMLQVTASLFLDSRSKNKPTSPLTDFLQEKKGELTMGGSSSKRTLFWQKKKKKKKRSPLDKTWSQLRGALPHKKRKRKSILSLDKLNLGNLRKEKNSQKRFSLPADKKEPISLKRFSLGNMKRESIQTASAGRKNDRGGLGEVRDQIKRKFSQEPIKGLRAQTKVVPPSTNPKERSDSDRQKNPPTASKEKASGLLRSIRPTGSKAKGQIKPDEL